MLDVTGAMLVEERDKDDGIDTSCLQISFTADAKPFTEWIKKELQTRIKRKYGEDVEIEIDTGQRGA